MSFSGEVANANPTTIQAFGDSDRPTSISIDISGNGSFSVRAYVEDRCVFATVPIVSSSGTVRHYTFRCPKSTDFGNNARWQIAATAALQTSIVARFSRRDPIVWQKPTLEEKPVVVPLEGGQTVQELPRQWRYANTVAR